MILRPASGDDAGESKARVGEPSMRATQLPRIDIDAQLIDPWSDTPDCSVDDPQGCVPGMRRFKRLVREDYYMAEAIWAGVFCSLGVGAGMSLVRAVIAASEASEPVTGYIYDPAAAASAAAAAAATLDQLAQVAL